MKKKIFDFIKKYAGKGSGIRTVTQWAILIYFGYVFYDIDQGEMAMMELDGKIAWIKAFENYYMMLTVGTVLGGGYGKYLDYKKGSGQP